MLECLFSSDCATAITATALKGFPKIDKIYFYSFLFQSNCKSFKALFTEHLREAGSFTTVTESGCDQIV